MSLNPSRTADRKIICAQSPRARRYWRLSRIYSLRAAQYTLDSLPQIWQSLQPAAARKIAGHKEYRLRQISLRYYDRYTKAAYLHIADSTLHSTH